MAKRPRLTELPDDLDSLLVIPEPALSPQDLATIKEAATLPPEEFQRALAPAYQTLMVKGLANVPTPQTLKELATAQKLFREAAGLDQKDKGALPMGLVAYMRPTGKRTLEVEAVQVAEVDEFGI